MKTPTPIKLLQKIDPVEMMGDKWHNQVIDLLFDGLDKRAKPYKEVLRALNEAHKYNEKRWVDIPVSYAKKLNGIMKSKTEKTYQKRLIKYVNFLAHGTHYGKLFNRAEINELSQLIKVEKKA